MSLTDDQIYNIGWEISMLDIKTIPEYRLAFARAIEAEATKPQEPVAWVEVVDRHEGPYNFHGKELLDSGKHNLFTTPQPCPKCASLDHQVSEGHKNTLRLESVIRDFEAQTKELETLSHQSNQDHLNARKDYQATITQQAERIAELEAECEFDQRNAAASQREAVLLLDKVETLEADIERLNIDFNEQEIRMHGIRQERDALADKLKHMTARARASDERLTRQIAVNYSYLTENTLYKDNGRKCDADEIAQLRAQLDALRIEADFNFKQYQDLGEVSNAESERLEAERDALAIQNQQMQHALSLWTIASDNSEECEFDDMAAYSIPMPLFCDADEATEAAIALPDTSEIIKRHDAEVIHKVMADIQGGSFLHDQAPPKLFADEVCKMLEHKAAELEKS